MAKDKNYETGENDGRKGFMAHSSNSDYRHGWWNGKQEYDYWNDKNLYPGLRHSNVGSRASSSSGDGRVGVGSIFVAIFAWLLVFAPFAPFFTWEYWIVQVVFWGGLVVIGLVFAMWIVSIIEEEKGKKTPPEPAEDPNLPIYKKYPPADVIKKQKKNN